MAGANLSIGRKPTPTGASMPLLVERPLNSEVVCWSFGRGNVE